MIIKDTQLDFRYPNDAAAIIGSWLNVYKKDNGIVQDSTTLFVYIGPRSVYSLKNKKEPITQATYIFQTLLSQPI